MARNQSAALTIKNEYLNERLLLQRGRRSFFCANFAGLKPNNKFLKILREYPKKIRQIESERRNPQNRRKIIAPSNATTFLRVSEGRFEVIQFTLPNPQIILG